MTKNRIYLEAAVKAGEYVLSIQYKEGAGPHQGGVPYVSKAMGPSYVEAAFTETALTLVPPFLELYNVTGESKYLVGVEGTMNKRTGGALSAIEFSLSLQVTPFYVPWGKHWFVMDKRAMGGFMHGYVPEGEGEYVDWQFGSTNAAAVQTLLELYKVTQDERFLKAAGYALRWLIYTDTRTPSNEVNELPGLKYIGSRHGLYKVGYSSSYGKYYDELEGTLSGHPKQGFTVAMSCAGPALLFFYLYFESVR